MTQSTDNEDFFTNKLRHNTHNPYVMIIGISDYSKTPDFSDLPAVKQDVENWYNLFSKEFGYPYVYKYLNKIEGVYDGDNGTIIKKTDLSNKAKFKHFAHLHIDQLKKKNKTDPIDSIIFIYGGHGTDRKIVGNNGRIGGKGQIEIAAMHRFFDNDSIYFMEGKPRIYIFDCCRGSYKEKTHRGGESQVNVSKDTIYWYGSGEGFVAFERKDKKGGVFSYEVYSVFLNMLQNGKYLGISSEISNEVFNRVLKGYGETQTPEFKKQLGYEVYLLPSKTSKWKIEIPKNLSKLTDVDENKKDEDENLSFISKYDESVWANGNEVLQKAFRSKDGKTYIWLVTCLDAWTKRLTIDNGVKKNFQLKCGDRDGQPSPNDNKKKYNYLNLGYVKNDLSIKFGKAKGWPIGTKDFVTKKYENCKGISFLFCWPNDSNDGHWNDWEKLLKSAKEISTDIEDVVPLEL